MVKVKSVNDSIFTEKVAVYSRSQEGSDLKGYTDYSSSREVHIYIKAIQSKELL